MVGDVPRPPKRPRVKVCCPVLKYWQRPRLTVSDSPCYVGAVAPNDAVTVTSWAGCDVGGAGGCLAPYEGACEDHGGAPEAFGRRVQDYSGRLTRSRGNLHRIGAGSYVSPFVFGYKTILERPLFLIGGCRRG